MQLSKPRRRGETSRHGVANAFEAGGDRATANAAWSCQALLGVYRSCRKTCLSLRSRSETTLGCRAADRAVVEARMRSRIASIVTGVQVDRTRALCLSSA